MSTWLRKIFYRVWYLQKPPWDTGISPPELMDYIKSHPPGKALDLGCGTGTNVITLAKHGWQACGVDFIGRAIQMARKKAYAEGINVEFHIDDVASLRNIAGKFNLILDIGCFHSIPQNKIKAYAYNINRLIDPFGNLLLYGFCSSDASSKGLSQLQFQALNTYLELIHREDCSDRNRPSVWLLYKKLSR